MILSALLSVIFALPSSSPSSTPAGSPGVVTRWEYNHAQIGWSRHHIHRLYDTKGEYVVAWYGEHGHLYIQRRYPRADGGWTSAIYRDTRPTPDGTQQGVMRLTRKAW